MSRRKPNPEELHSFIPSTAEPQDFTNEFGETWRFEFDPATGHGSLSGDELGDDRVAIVNGVIAGGLMLGADEFEWLDAAWRAATGSGLKTKCFAAEIQRAIARAIEGN